VTRRIRVSLVSIAVILALVGLGAARVPSLTVDQIQRMIDKTIADRVPGMIDTAIEGITVETTIIEQGVTIEDVNAAIDAKVPGMIESALDERLGGEDVNPAIPLPIITNPVAGAINVRDYGAIGDGLTDDRVAIQAALNACDGSTMTTVYVPDGVYMVSMVSNGMVLAPKSNTKLQLANNATIQLIPQPGATRVTSYGIIRTVASTANLEICGGRILGELAYQWYTNGRPNEYGAGIRVHDSSNIYVHDMAIDDCWGDGAIFTSATTTGYCRDVRMERCTFDGAYRDNVTANAILNGYFSDLQFKNGLQCFVDAEPNYVGNICYNVVFDNCHGNNSVRYWGYCFGFGAWYNQIVSGTLPTHGYPYSVHFKNCTGTNTYTSDPTRADGGLWNRSQMRNEAEANAATRNYFKCYINGTEIVYP
jgi:hypothetical protein